MRPLSILALVCCSCGDEFSAASLTVEGGAGASAGAAGATASDGGFEATAGASGHAGMGAAGSPAGGSGGQAGTGGTSGSSSAGAGSGGSSGSVGTGGSGATAPSCTPDQAVRAELFPTTFVWPEWSWAYDGKCITCATTPCASAQPLLMVPTIASPPRWNNGELELLFESTAATYASFRAGACGNESDCAFKPRMGPPTVVSVEPVGNAWRITKVLRVTSNHTMQMDQSTCTTLIPDYTAAALADSYRAALDAALTGIVMSCP